jgi:hypothetical protein
MLCDLHVGLSLEPSGVLEAGPDTRAHGTITPSLIQAQSRYMTRLLSTVTVYDT